MDEIRDEIEIAYHELWMLFRYNQKSLQPFSHVDSVDVHIRGLTLRAANIFGEPKDAHCAEYAANIVSIATGLTSTGFVFVKRLESLLTLIEALESKLD